MRDYWLSKLFFDLQAPEAAAEYRANRAGVLARYPLKPEALRAVEEEDVPALANWVNPYLLRFFFVAIGKPEAWFLERIRKAARPVAESAHG
jgi:hypothetical protein